MDISPFTFNCVNRSACCFRDMDNSADEVLPCDAITGVTPMDLITGENVALNSAMNTAWRAPGLMDSTSHLGTFERVLDPTDNENQAPETSAGQEAPTETISTTMNPSTSPTWKQHAEYCNGTWKEGLVKFYEPAQLFSLQAPLLPAEVYFVKTYLFQCGKIELPAGCPDDRE